MRHIATTHPISWFAERDQEGNLDLRPNFQRRQVWADRQKSNRIESVLLELPVPEIYMQIKTTPEGRSEYIVVDGQQRISAILEFAGSNGREPFEMQNLDNNSVWEGYTFSDLDDDERSAFYGHSMAVRYLQDARDEEIKDLFKRLNKYPTPLNRQELRNAAYRGPFLRLSESIAEEEYWYENGLVTPSEIRRMRDIEFISDLLIGVLDGPQSGNAKTLDDYYHMLEDHEPEFRGQRDCKRNFNLARNMLGDLVPDLRSTRWSNKTDFYSLFVVLAGLLRGYVLRHDKSKKVSAVLTDFETEIKRYQDDESPKTSSAVKEYVGAIRRGSSDRTRRGTRHRALLELLKPYFKER